MCRTKKALLKNQWFVTVVLLFVVLGLACARKRNDAGKRDETAKRDAIEWGVFGQEAEVSPDNEYLAFWAGPLPAPGRDPISLNARLFFLCLDANDVLCCRNLVLGSSGLAWQPNAPSQLFVVQDRFVETARDELFGCKLIGFQPAEEPAPEEPGIRPVVL